MSDLVGLTGPLELLRQLSEQENQKPRVEVETETGPVDLFNDPAFMELLTVEERRNPFVVQGRVNTRLDMARQNIRGYLADTYGLSDEEIDTMVAQGLFIRDARQRADNALKELENERRAEERRRRHEEFGQMMNEFQRQAEGQFTGAITQSLKPLQIPADIAMAALVGALDPSTTVAERFRRQFAPAEQFADLPDDATLLQRLQRNLSRIGAYNPLSPQNIERTATGREAIDLLLPMLLGDGPSAEERVTALTQSLVEQGLEGDELEKALEEQVLPTLLAGNASDVPDWAKNILGAALDVTVDPLLFGSIVSGVGRVAKVDALVTAGRNIEQALAPAGAARAARAGLRLVSPALERSISVYLADGINRLLNAPVPFLPVDELGFSEFRAPFLRRSEKGAKTVTMGELLGTGELRNPFLPTEDVLSGGAGRPFIAVDAELTGRASQLEVVNEAQQRFANLATMFGRETVTGLQRSQTRAITEYARTVGAIVKDFDQELQDVMINLSRDVVDSRGTLLDLESINTLTDVPLSTKLTINRLRVQYPEVFGENLAEELLSLRGSLYARSSVVERRAIERVREVASNTGVDPDLAVETFRSIVAETAGLDAFLGFKASLYEPVKDGFISAGMQRLKIDTDDPAALVNEVWRDILGQYGALSQERQQLRAARRATKGSVRGLNDPPRLSEIDTVLGRPIGDVFEGVKNANDLFKLTPYSAAGLSVDQYMDGLVNGHLRRTFSVHLGADSLARIRRRLESGKISLSQFVTDDILSSLGSGGFEQETGLLRRYMESVSPVNNIERGVILRIDNLTKFMMQNGIPKEQAERFFYRLAAEANPQAAALLEGARAKIAGYLSEERSPINVGGVGAQRRLRLTRQDLELLGQVNDPLVGLAEQAARTANSVRYTEALSSLYRDASRLGYVSSRQVPGGGFVKMGRERGFGPFSGKWVNPWLAKEIRNFQFAALDGPARNNALTSLRAAITGSRLARPATTLANLAGGIYSALLYGINPLDFASETTRVMFEWGQQGDNFADAERLRGELFGTSLVRNEIPQFGRFLKEEDVLNVGGAVDLKDLLRRLRSVSRGLSDGYRQVVQNPLGFIRGEGRAAKFARRVGSSFGVEAFEFVENSMKIAAYRLAIKEGLSEGEALFRARNVVFDYSTQPEILRGLRDSQVGALAFPFLSFPFFMSARTVNAIINRPGTLGAVDRLGNALFRAGSGFNDTIAHALFASLDPEDREAGHVPILRESDALGNLRMTSIAFREFAPINMLNFPLRVTSAAIEYFGGNPTGASEDIRAAAGALDSNPLSTRARELAFFGAGLDFLGGVLFGTPKGSFTGRQVTVPQAEAGERIGQSLQFLFNNFAPTNLAGLFNFGRPSDTGTEQFLQGLGIPLAVPDEGLVPDLVRLAQQYSRPSTPFDLANEEIFRQIDRARVTEEALRFFIRSPEITNFSPTLGVSPGGRETVTPSQELPEDSFLRAFERQDRRDRDIETELNRQLAETQEVIAFRFPNVPDTDPAKAAMLEQLDDIRERIERVKRRRAVRAREFGERVLPGIREMQRLQQERQGR